MSTYTDASLIMFPSGYKEDKIYSLKPTDGSGDLTFTRASTATRVNSDGLIETSPVNLVQQSETFSNAIWTKSTTTFSVDTLTASAGTTFKGIDQNQSTQGLQNVYFDVAYISHQWLQILFGTSGSDLGYANFDIQNKVVGTSSGSYAGQIQDFGTYVRISLSLNASAKVGVALAFVDSGSSTRAASTSSTGAFKLLRSQVNIGSTAKPYFPTTDRLNVPRIDYTGGGCGSLLLESQRTNLITFSEQLDNAAWNKLANAAVTANTSVSPDGYTNADSVIYDGTSNGRVEQIIAGISGNHTFSVYVKVASGTQSFNIGNGAAELTYTATTTWQRFTISDVPIGSTFYPRVICNSANTLQVWGAQLEAGSYATSYIPTLASSVTRLADFVSKSGISSLIGSTEGVLYAEVDYKITTQSGTVLLDVNDNDVTNRVALLFGNGIVGGFVQGSVRISYTVPSFGTYKIAFAYKSGDFVLYVNGVQRGTSSSAITFSGMNQLFLGQTFTLNDTQPVNGIRQALIFKTRLTNTELATLTTL